MPFQATRFLVPALGLWIGVFKSAAGSIPIPNASFETPVTAFVSVFFDSWTPAPKPDWYEETGGFLWNQLTGLFKNPVAGSADHIDNCDGNQAAWLFAIPEVALSQSLGSPDSQGGGQESSVRFEPGKAYRLTVGLIGGGGAMLPGVTLQMELGYRDLSSNLLTVASCTITNDPAVLSSTTHFVDFEASLPVVKPEDAWADKTVEIRFRSTVSSELRGGYWDLDHVRLDSFLAPSLQGPVWTNGMMGFQVTGEPGYDCEILSTTNLDRPISEWALVTVVTNLSEPVFLVTPEENRVQFYGARQNYR